MAICERLLLPEYLNKPITHSVILVDPELSFRVEFIPQNPCTSLRIYTHDLDDIEALAPKYFSCRMPSTGDVAKLIEMGKSISASDADWGLLVSCEAGISRSPASAIVLLVSMGYEPETAFDLALQAVPAALPNRRILRLADEMLGTGGSLLRLGEKHRVESFSRAGMEDPVKRLFDNVSPMMKMAMKLWRKIPPFSSTATLTSSVGATAKEDSRRRLGEALQRVSSAPKGVVTVGPDFR